MKRFVIVLMVCLSVFSSSVSSYANTVQDEYLVNEETQITLRADVIVVKTRTHNGVAQYRRWNETRQCWVDPYWMNL